MKTAIPEKFTYPFCYEPNPLIVKAARGLIERIDSTPELRSIFSEGKMMGILMVQNGNNVEFLYGFSGLAGGRSTVDGFVPPIFDLTDPDGYFKNKEAEISGLNRRIAAGDGDIAALKSQRKDMSIALQEWIFRQYVVLNARGERRNILDIFADRGLLPPGGTGDCAAPKLLQSAYLRGLKPLAMGEFWYGESPAREIRRQGCFYPSCTGKCGPLLAYMLEGLEVEDNPLDSDEVLKRFNGGSDILGGAKIIFEDDTLIVVDKPSGMLAVPGRTLKVSLEERLKKALDTSEIYSCHRLDMDTSGLMVYAKTLQAQAELRQQFERRLVEKSYLALLAPGENAPAAGTTGRIELPLALDYYDRPRQMVDFESGRQAVTDYEILEVRPGGTVLVRFTPLTGRTHQLRVHAASPLGLGRPIAGDRLYGGDAAFPRLCLHAATLSFTHPRTGERMHFESSDIIGIFAI